MQRKTSLVFPSVLLRLLLGVSLTCLPCLAQLKQVPNLKLRESAHLRCFYTGDFRVIAPQIISDSEAFLDELAARWSLILPTTRMSMTLGTDPLNSYTPHLDHARDLMVQYNEKVRRIEVRIFDFDDYSPTALRQQVNHAVLHALLDQTEAELPIFAEEAVARYYAGNLGSRDHFLAILAFRQTDHSRDLLKPELWSKSKNAYLTQGSISRLFYEYLLSLKEGNEALLIQSFLKGEEWAGALRTAGFRNEEALFEEFEKVYRPKFGLSKIFLTLDFWLIFLGSLVAGYLIVRIVLALKVARMGYVEIAAPKHVDVTPRDFAGPAFGNMGSSSGYFLEPPPVFEPGKRAIQVPTPAPNVSMTPDRKSSNQRPPTPTPTPTPYPKIEPPRHLPRDTQLERPIRPPRLETQSPKGPMRPPSLPSGQQQIGGVGIPHQNLPSDLEEAFNDLDLAFDDAFDQLLWEEESPNPNKGKK